MLRQIARLSRPAVAASRTLAVTARVQSGPSVSMSAEQVEAAWVEYFDQSDYWDLRRGIREILTDDMVPTPEIAQVNPDPLTQTQNVLLVNLVLLPPY